MKTIGDYASYKPMAEMRGFRDLTANRIGSLNMLDAGIPV
jgi:hypothetical protein